MVPLLPRIKHPLEGACDLKKVKWWNIENLPVDFCPKFPIPATFIPKQRNVSGLTQQIKIKFYNSPCRKSFFIYRACNNTTNFIRGR